LSSVGNDVVESENNRKLWNGVIEARKRGEWNEYPSGKFWESMLEGENCSLEEKPLFAFGSCESFVKFVNPLSHMEITPHIC
jgi:hypothetical protein